LFLLFIHLSLNLKHLTHGSKGSVIKYLTKGMIEDFTFIFPNETILEKFNNLCENIFSQIETLEKQNQRLKSARDILLPRLMNRTIEV
jgi:type I restriction enzyme S subunit